MNTNNVNNIDKIFNESFNGFSIEPPAKVWASIKDAVNKKEQKRSLLFAFRIAASIAAVISMGIISWILSSHNNNDNPITKNNHEQSGNELITSASELKQNKTADLTNSNTDVISYNNNERNTSSNNANDENAGSTNIIVILLENPQNNTEIIFDNNITSSEDSNTNAETAEVNQLILEDTIYTALDSIEKKTLIVQNQSLIGQEHYNNEAYYADLIPETKIKKWFIGGQITPTYAYRALSDDNVSNEIQMEQSEAGLASYSGGIDIGYKTSKRLQIQTGIYYAQIGTTVDLEYNPGRSYTYTSERYEENEVLVIETSAGKMYCQLNNESTNSSINIINNNPELDGYSLKSINGTTKGTTTFNYEYIEIPMIVKYRMINRKIGLSVLGGMGANILIDEAAIYTQDDIEYEMTKETNANSLNLSTTIGMGLNYNISKKIELVLEPTFKLYLNTISNENSDVDGYYPYLIGLYTGFNFSL